MTLSDTDKQHILQLARDSVAAYVNGQPVPTPPAEGVFAERRGCFVTLTNRGQLRGCIGTFQPTGPLGAMIVEMAKAATTDPRFTMNPITPEEVGQLTVEVSVLTPLEKSDDPAGQIEIGKHGIYITGGYQSGCFLPEVAVDHHLDTPEKFMDVCCEHKAGLPAGAWREQGTDVYLFTTEKIT
jgi:hypothetical protein